MTILTLKRFSSTDRGTFGVFLDEKGLPIADSVELPWKQNAPNVSCIPAGEYVCKKSFYNKGNYEVYELQNVPNRTDILIHAGNSILDIRGCILIGCGWGRLGQNPAVINSRDTLKSFMYLMKDEPEFKLVICEI